MKNRLISTIVLCPIVIGCIFFLSLEQFFIFNFLICIISIIEWGQLSGLRNITYQVFFSLFFIIFTLCITLLNKEFFEINNIRYVFLISLFWWIIAFLLILTYPTSSKIWKNYIIMKLIFGLLIIIPFFFGVLVLRRYYYIINSKDTPMILIYLLVIIWTLDSSSYLFGKKFGKYKIAPKISPKKTWEGLLVGIFISLIISGLFIKYLLIDTDSITLFTYSIFSIFFSILGDLTESMFKREAKIKDSSQLIPGHGGILDRIDSLTFSIPIFSFFLLFDVFKEIIKLHNFLIKNIFYFNF